MAQRYEGKVAIVGIGSLDDREAIEAFVEKYDLDLIPNVIDVEGSIRSDLGVVGQPHWLFITADGKRQKVFGEISDGGLTERLDALLEG